ncbi:MAG: aminotransferase class IV [Planctomycetaceae bacterium]|nr:aminotransferase class IV [Planctomycetaceae bacterium]
MKTLEPVAFLNHRWIPASAAAISVGDAGFIQGAAIAEQLRTFGGRMFQLDAHFDRLFHSLEIVGLAPDVSREQLARTAEELVARNHPLLPTGADLGVSIVITPGSYPNYAASELPKPTVCLHTYPLPFFRWARKYREGQSLRTTDVEQVSPRCWPPSLKCRSRMHYYLADRQAAAVEPPSRALLLDAQRFVTEASTANIAAYRAEEGLVLPPAEKVLPGVSLAATVAMAGQLGHAVVQRDQTVDQLVAVDELFLTSTPFCLLPVVQLNGRPIGDGRPGPMFRQLIAAWNQRVGLDIVRQAELFS